MKLSSYYLLTFLFLLVSFGANAQMAKSYFNDEELNKGGSRIDCHLNSYPYIVVGGGIGDYNKSQPVIYKIDTTGKLIWTAIGDTSHTRGNGAYQDYGSIKKICFSSDSNLLAYSSVVLNVDSAICQVWKINYKTGKFIWKKTFYPWQISDMNVYDQHSLLVSCTFRVSSGIAYGEGFAKISQDNGDTIYTYAYNNSNGAAKMAIDQSHFIYAVFDHEVIKFDSGAVNNLLWDSTYLLHNAVLLHFEDVSVYSSSKLLIFGHYGDNIEYAMMSEIDITTGHLLGYVYSQANLEAAMFQADKIVGNYAYVSYTHPYSSAPPFKTVRYNISSITVDWENDYAFSGVNHNLKIGGSPQSIDVDNNGDVYVTGSYNRDVAPAYWGIIKINGATGNAIYEQTIYQDLSIYQSSIIVNPSSGCVATVFNNSVYFMGTEGRPSPYSSESEVMTLVKIDPTTGELLAKTRFGGEFQLPSATVKIMKYNNNTVVLKQMGTITKVEMYDAAKNLLWKKQFQKNGLLQAWDLAKMPNGQLLIIAQLQGYINYPHVPMASDSDYIFYMDSLGNKVKETNFAATLPVLLQTITDNTGNILLALTDTTYNLCSLLRINGDSVTKEIDMDVYNYPTPGEQHIMTNLNESEFVYVGAPYGLAPVGYRINKDTYFKSRYPTKTYHFADFQKISYIASVGNNLILSGSNQYGQPTLGSYNMDLQQYVWHNSNIYLPGRFYKFIFSPDSASVYVLAQVNGVPSVYKVVVATGNVLWSKSIPANFKYDSFPLDIAANKTGSQMIITGYGNNTDFNAFTKDIFISYVDTAGKFSNTSVIKGDLPGDNAGVCVAPMENGDYWIGGYIKHNPYKNAGFLFDTDPSYVFPPDSVPLYSCNAYFQLYPDSSLAHNWWALNKSAGVQPLTYIWSWGDGTTSLGGVTQLHKYTDPGYYHLCLTITDNTGCSSSYCDSTTYLYRVDGDNAMVIVHIVNSIPTTVQTVHANTLPFMLFPNPCSTCNVVGAGNVTDLTVTDLLGRDVIVNFTGAGNNLSFSLTASPAGFYIIHNRKTGEALKFMKD